jgi:hypothetical protein
MFTPLTLTHLRFHARATTELKLAGHLAGNNLRNAMANVMRYSTCPETNRRERPSPEHAATCPACWLLSADLDPGSVVRAYCVLPPMPPQDYLQPGESFVFGLTIFGDGLQFLPYLVLAVNEIGRIGVGPGRGNFELQAIYAVDPYTNQTQLLKAVGDVLVRMPELLVEFTSVAPAANAILANLPKDGTLTLHFLSPLRLIEKERYFKIPDFGVLFQRLLLRSDDLARQYAGGKRRDRSEVKALHDLANGVRLVENNARWQELWSWSGRKQRKTPLSGLLGRATYYSRDWSPLLPWLVWGQGIQVGKSAVKGNGIYKIADMPMDYWSWLESR